MKKILFLIFFVLLGNFIMAQTGSSPFVGSTHTYYVNSSDNGATHNSAHNNNKYQWYVTTDATGNTAANTAHYSVAEGTWDASNPVQNLYKINITWNSASEGNTYYLFVEESASNLCISKRRIQVVVGANNFDISIGNLATTCSDASGSVIVNSDNSNLGNTSKQFTINMQTQSDMSSATYVPDWKFNYTVSMTGGNLVSVTFDDNTSVASPVLSGQSATGTVTVNNNDYSINVTVVFTNVWNSSDQVTVTLSNGTELSYNTSENSTTNNAGSVTIKALPETSNIMTD
jgi:hypothetical protein